MQPKTESPVHPSSCPPTPPATSPPRSLPPPIDEELHEDLEPSSPLIKKDTVIDIPKRPEEEKNTADLNEDNYEDEVLEIEDGEILRKVNGSETDETLVLTIQGIEEEEERMREKEKEKEKSATIAGGDAPSEKRDLEVIVEKNLNKVQIVPARVRKKVRSIFDSCFNRILEIWSRKLSYISCKYRPLFFKLYIIVRVFLQFYIH